MHDNYQKAKRSCVRHSVAQTLTSSTVTFRLGHLACRTKVLSMLTNNPNARFREATTDSTNADHLKPIASYINSCIS